jgi:hypothetical protein
MGDILALEVFPIGVWQTILGHCDSETFAKLFIIAKAILLDSHIREVFRQIFVVRLSFKQERRFIYLPVPHASLLTFERQTSPSFRLCVKSPILSVNINDDCLPDWNFRGDRVDYTCVKMLDFLLVATKPEKRYVVMIPENLVHLRFRFQAPVKR